MAERHPLATILLVAGIAGAAAVLVTASWEFSRERIAANERARLLANLSSVLSADLLSRDLNPVAISVTDTALLGSEEPVDVFLPMDGLTPEAAIFASSAPDGYNAPIDLLVGIDFDTGIITGVRVVSHRETPGLGDQIEIGKSDWILQFDGKSVDEPPPEAWNVVKEEGQFDSITGATVTPRAVIGAVHDTLRYFESHRAMLTELARAAVEAANESEPF